MKRYFNYSLFAIHYKLKKDGAWEVAPYQFDEFNKQLNYQRHGFGGPGLAGGFTPGL